MDYIQASWRKLLGLPAEQTLDQLGPADLEGLRGVAVAISDDYHIIKAGGSPVSSCPSIQALDLNMPVQTDRGNELVRRDGRTFCLRPPPPARELVITLDPAAAPAGGGSAAALRKEQDELMARLDAAPDDEQALRALVTVHERLAGVLAQQSIAQNPARCVHARAASLCA